MAAIPEQTLFNEILDFLASAPSKEEILAYQPSPSLQVRARLLLEKQRGVGLDEFESEELAELGRINHFMVMLKARTRISLANS
jgi:hypothetical protein